MVKVEKSEGNPPEVQSVEEKKWLKRHPKVNLAIKITKPIIVPIVVAVMGVYFDYRLQLNKEKAEAGYDVTVPAMQDLQEQVKMLTVKIDLIQQFLPLITNGNIKPVPPTIVSKPTKPKVTKPKPEEKPVASVPVEAKPVLTPAPSLEAYKKSLGEYDLLNKINNAPSRSFLQKPMPRSLDDAFKMQSGPAK